MWNEMPVQSNYQDRAAHCSGGKCISLKQETVLKSVVFTLQLAGRWIYKPAVSQPMNRDICSRPYELETSSLCFEHTLFPPFTCAKVVNPLLCLSPRVFTQTGNGNVHMWMKDDKHTWVNYFSVRAESRSFRRWNGSCCVLIFALVCWCLRIREGRWKWMSDRKQLLVPPSCQSWELKVEADPLTHLHRLLLLWLCNVWGLSVIS